MKKGEGGWAAPLNKEVIDEPRMAHAQLLSYHIDLWMSRR